MQKLLTNYIFIKLILELSNIAFLVVDEETGCTHTTLWEQKLLEKQWRSKETMKQQHLFEADRWADFHKFINSFARNCRPFTKLFNVVRKKRPIIWLHMSIFWQIDKILSSFYWKFPWVIHADILKTSQQNKKKTVSRYVSPAPGHYCNIYSFFNFTAHFMSLFGNSKPHM